MNDENCFVLMVNGARYRIDRENLFLAVYTNGQLTDWAAFVQRSSSGFLYYSICYRDEHLYAGNEWREVVGGDNRFSRIEDIEPHLDEIWRRIENGEIKPVLYGY